MCAEGMLSRPVAVFLMFAALSHAQTSRGTVTGTVLDSSGAAVAGASVDLTGIETGVEQSTRSNDAGIYRFDAVDPGFYRLAVAHPGFKSYGADRVGVEANRATTIDPRLEIGDASTRVDVSA